MKRGLLLFCLWAACAFCSLAFAQPAIRLLPAQSEIVFTSKQMGVPVEGRFARFDARIDLDPTRPETGSISFSIDTRSATLGLAETDAELNKAGWFDTARFPQATFQSTRLKSLGAGRFEVRGKLTIKGAEHEVVVPTLIAQAQGTSVATGSFTLKRLEFKLGEAEWADLSLVADDVLVRFKLAMTGLAPLR